MGAFTAPTQTDREFHCIDRTYASTAVRKALTKGILTRDDADLINEFVTELQASRGITLIKVNKIVSHLINWRPATTGDLFSAIAAIKEAKNQRGRPFKQNTLHDCVMFLKRFYLWLIENGILGRPGKEGPKDQTATDRPLHKTPGSDANAGRDRSAPAETVERADRGEEAEG